MLPQSLWTQAVPDKCFWTGVECMREETKAMGRETGKWAYSARGSTVPQTPGLQGVHPSACELLFTFHLHLH